MRKSFLLIAASLSLAFALVVGAQPATQGSGLKSASEHVEPLNPEEPQFVSIPEHERRAAADNSRLTGVGLPEVAPASAAAWSKTVNLPSQYQKGWWYKTNPPATPPPGVPTASSIYAVSYSWSIGGGTPPGQVVYLCYNDGTDCLDVSPLPVGTTTAFNGRSANHSFWFYIKVSGSGMLNPPTIGGQAQVIVNYNY